MDLNTVVWGMQLVWWLVIGIVLVGIVVLALACLPVVRRLPGLRRGGERLQRHAEAAQALSERTEELQRRTEEITAQAGRAQARIAQRKRDRQRT